MAQMPFQQQYMAQTQQLMQQKNYPQQMMGNYAQMPMGQYGAAENFNYVSQK